MPGALAWNADQLSSGSRDRVILQRDIRAPPLQSERRLQGHRQEVCGLKWSTDHQLLASGGNDNKVCSQGLSPVYLWATYYYRDRFLIKHHKLISLPLLPLFQPADCSYLCGTTRVFSRCSSTQSTWLLWKPSPGLPTSMACWPREAALPTAASASGTLWLASPYSAQTPALRSATWPGQSTRTNWWVSWRFRVEQLLCLKVHWMQVMCKHLRSCVFIIKEIFAHCTNSELNEHYF